MMARSTETKAAGRVASTKKYERVKLKTTLTSSSVSRTASAPMRPVRFSSAMASGWSPVAVRTRPTRYAALLRKNTARITCRPTTRAPRQCASMAPAMRAASLLRSSYPTLNSWRLNTRVTASSRLGAQAKSSQTSPAAASASGRALAAATNSRSESTPTVVKMRRVIELKNVSASSASVRSPTRAR